MTYSMTWLAGALIAAGLKVVEEGDWTRRGRGEMGTVRGVMCHHTAGPRTGNSPSLNLVINGRSDLPGPLSQLFLARDGTFHVISAGRTNHAGRGSWQGVTAGNSSFIGIEAENAGNGFDPWPHVQMDAYVRGVAAILAHIGEDSVMACGHKEFALPRGRKIDPAFDMEDFRNKVGSVMAGYAHAGFLAPILPVRAMLRKGSSGNSVRELQLALDARGFKLTADGHFGPQTLAAVKAFQSATGLMADGLVGPKTWAALGVNNS